MHLLLYMHATIFLYMQHKHNIKTKKEKTTKGIPIKRFTILDVRHHDHHIALVNFLSN